jgi:S1-C subfamily serine protease
MNHVPISSLADYRAQVAKLKPGDDVLFRVARHGENDRVLMLFLAGSVPSTK